MHYKDLAISKLLINNYHFFIPLNSGSDEIVVKIKGDIKLCLIRPARETGNNSNVLFGSDLDFLIHDYILVVEKSTKRAWLIPTRDLDSNKKSMMLSAFANNYCLVPQQDIVREFVKKKRDIEVRKETAKVIMKSRPKNKIKTNEDIMNLLSKG